MNRLLLLTGALALVAAAGPVLADDAPALHGACAAPEGATVLVPGAEGEPAAVTTPLGAANLGLAVTEVGDYYVDLSGLPEDTTAEIAFTLAWDSLLPVADYDLITAGDNAASTDSPETKLVPVGHCEALPVAVDVFTGLPTDTLTLAATATAVEAFPEEEF